jgi:hypothetical protein
VNIADLIRVLHGQNATRWNQGPIANGLLESTLQEVRFYAMVLGEFEKDSLITRTGQAPMELLDTQKVHLSSAERIRQIEILPYLKTESFDRRSQGYPSLDLSNHLQMQNVAVIPALNFAQGRNLIWQNQLLSKIDELKHLLSGLQVRSLPTKAGRVADMPVSSLKMEDLEEKIVEVSQYLKELRGEHFAEQTVQTVAQKNLVDLCFRALGKALTDLRVISQAANAASYVESHDQQVFVSRRCDNQKQVPKYGFSGVREVQRMAEGC